MGRFGGPSLQENLPHLSQEIEMDLAKHWRQRAARYRLEGQRHHATGEVRFAAEPAEGWEPYNLSGAGTVYSFSVVRQPPEGYEDHAPYVLALIRLDDGP